MKTIKLLGALALSSVLFTSYMQAGDKPAGDSAKCCAKAAGDGKACDHACCVDAAKAGKNCEKCGGKNEKKT